MLKYVTLFIGLFFFSVVTGLMIGLSESAVVGVFVTSVFGVLVAMVGIFQLKASGAYKFLSDISLNKFGVGLISFSFGLAIGVFMGIFIRTGYFEDTVTSPAKTSAATKTELVWQSGIAPESVYEALDWIIIQQLLLDRGYSNEQIKEIYNLRKKGEYDEDEPYALMLNVLEKKNDSSEPDRLRNKGPRLPFIRKPRP
jgi:hypothetical protein